MRGNAFLYEKTRKAGWTNEELQTIFRSELGQTVSKESIKGVPSRDQGNRQRNPSSVGCGTLRERACGFERLWGRRRKWRAQRSPRPWRHPGAPYSRGQSGRFARRQNRRCPRPKLSGYRSAMARVLSAQLFQRSKTALKIALIQMHLTKRYMQKMCQNQPIAPGFSTFLHSIKKNPSLLRRILVRETGLEPLDISLKPLDL